MNNTTLDRHPTHLSLSLLSLLFSVFAVLNRPTCVSGKHYPYTQWEGENLMFKLRKKKSGTESDFCLWGKRETCVCLSLGAPPNSPLSWSVIQQKNGSIKSWSSPCQVTPRKWVLKLFFFFFFFLVGWDGGSRTGLTFKVRKWKLCFLMSCLSGCLCVWWSVKCSVTLTKWLSLCCCGF